MRNFVCGSRQISPASGPTRPPATNLPIFNRLHHMARILAMKVLPLAEVKNRFSAVVDEVARTHEAVSVSRNGIPVVVIIAGDDYESLLETLDLAFDEEERARVAEAYESIRSGDVTTRDEMAALMKERVRREAGLR